MATWLFGSQTKWSSGFTQKPFLWKLFLNNIQTYSLHSLLWPSQTHNHSDLKNSSPIWRWVPCQRPHWYRQTLWALTMTTDCDLLVWGPLAEAMLTETLVFLFLWECWTPWQTYKWSLPHLTASKCFKILLFSALELLWAVSLKANFKAAVALFSDVSQKQSHTKVVRMLNTVLTISKYSLRCHSSRPLQTHSFQSVNLQLYI